MSEDSAFSLAPVSMRLPQLKGEEEIVTYTTLPSNIGVDKVRVNEIELINDERDLTQSRNTKNHNSSHRAGRILSKHNMEMEDKGQEVASKWHTKLCQVGVMITFIIGILSAPIILYYTGRGGIKNVSDESYVLNCRELVGHISNMYRNLHTNHISYKS